MTDSHGPSDSFKKQILKECKRLTNDGQLIEASHLFRAYFPEKSFCDLDRIWMA